MARRGSKRRHEPAARVATRPATAPSLFWVVVAVLAAALAVRIYYFVLTRGQPVWWDEAEYLLAARHVVHDTPMTGFFIGRPMLLSWVLSASYAVGLDELGARLFLVAVSLAGVYLVYSVGRRLHGQMVGLVAALLFSTIYIHVFYTNRVLTEIPHVTACLFAFDLLLSDRPRRVLFAVPMFVIGALTRFPAALMFAVVLAYAGLVGRARLLRSRPFLGSLGIAVLVGAPYLVWATVTHGDPLAAYKASQFHIPDLGFADGLEGLRFYATTSYHTLGPVLTALLGLGTLRALRFLVAPRRLVVDGDPRLAAGFLLAVWMAVPVFYFSFRLRPLDDRFCILAVPPALIAIGEAVVWLTGLVLRKSPRWHAGVAVAAGLAGALFMLPLTHRQVMSKLQSYAEVRDAALDMAKTSDAKAVLMTQSAAQVSYYSQRATTNIPRDPLKFMRRLAEEHPRFLMLSAMEEHPKWLTMATLRALGLRPRATYPPGRRGLVMVFDVPPKLGAN